MRFLIVTFTRAARDEVNQRLAGTEFADIISNVDVATLNAWGNRRLRQHRSPKLLTSKRDKSWCIRNALQPVWSAHKRVAEAMAQPNFVGPLLMEVSDSLKRLGFRHEAGQRAFRKRLQSLSELNLEWMIDGAIAKLTELEVLQLGTYGEFVKVYEPFWKQSCISMIAQSLFTLEDQKYVALLDLIQQQNERRMPIGGGRITHVLVDEFQDINPLDLDLIKHIVEINKAELTIVGDDDQAIFEWRGATPNYILSPELYFNQPFETYILERNYRCPRNLVKAAQRLITHNTHRYQKRVSAMNLNDADVIIIEREKFDDSIDAVMAEVRGFLKTAPETAKVALISRKRAQLIPYQILMVSENISFCAAEDLRVFMSAAFENLSKILLVCAKAKQRADTLSIVSEIIDLCNQVKRYPLRMNEKAMLTGHLKSARPRTYSSAIEALSDYRGPLKGPNENGEMSHNFAMRISNLLEVPTVTQAIDTIGASFSGFEKDYFKAVEDIFYSDPPFLYLADFARRYEDDFERFLYDLDLAKDTLSQLYDHDEAASWSDDWTRRVHLMTAQRAKGKEFDTAIMLDMNDGIWPSRLAETPAQMEQERRVFYVAMTRAKRNLIFTLSNRIGDYPASPSPFLTEAGFRS